MAQFQLKKSRFIDWYFADPETRIDFGNNAISELKHFGTLDVTTQGLFDTCGYIPQWLCEGQSDDDDQELEPGDIELIN